ncbi:MAG: TlpA family protein disulfide reductase [Coprobacillus sp.]|nr:MAG: TlpA family protein disulfide reductase [Coprobacillus sp.]
MKKKILWAVVVMGAVALFVGAFFLYDYLRDAYEPGGLAVQTESSQSAPAETVAAPDFSAVDGDGNEVRLSDYFGKPIVLNFWASWCPPCKAEMPHFENAFQERTDIQFLMVNMTTSSRESLKAAKAFIAEEGYTFPVLFDTEGAAAAAYGASSLPITFFIDKNGNLVTYGVGMLSAEILEKGMGMIAE